MVFAVITSLSFVVLFLSVRLIVLKRQIRSVSRQLDDHDNKLISVMLTDSDLEETTCKINAMIDQIAEIRAESRKSAEATREAIANITHDIRTPLTSVIGYLQLALKENTTEEQKSCIRIALERAGYCSRLVDDLFESTVFETKEIEVHPEKTDVNALLCELILANYPEFSAHHVTPHFHDHNAPVYIMADPKLLTRILQNIISNSVKYADKDVYFTIKTGDHVTIEISNPTTEPLTDADRIFEKFYRAEKARSASGTGIGLYLCKLLTEAMQGTIGVRYEDGVLVLGVCFEACDGRR